MLHGHLVGLNVSHIPDVAGKGVGALRDHDPHFGFGPVHFALIFGIISGTSLPLGAYVGIYFSPVHDTIIAMMMAFGAGALLFAVTVELYGHALSEVAAGRLTISEIFTTIGGALAGAALYLVINKWLEHSVADVDSASVSPDSTPRVTDVEQPQARRSAHSHGSHSHAHEAAPLMGALKEAERYSAEQQESGSKPTASKWGVLRDNLKVIRSVSFMKQKDLTSIRPREKVMRAVLDDAEIRHAKSVALALFVGLVVDGVPEGILMGFLSAEGHLTPVLLVSLWIANFPEACASASLLIQAEMSRVAIIGMWLGLCLLVGCLCGLACFVLLFFFPAFGQPAHGHDGALPHSVLLGIALIEGITGGSMIACISSVMLPEALSLNKHGNVLSQSGFLCTSGFLMSVALKALFG